MKNYILYIIVALFFNCCTDIKEQNQVKKNENRDSDSINIDKCFDSFLREIPGNKISFGKYNLSGLIIEEERIYFKEEKVLINDSSLIDWLYLTSRELTEVYHLHDKNDNYYLLSSFLSGGAGLAVNLTPWLLVDINSKKSFYVRSFSEKADYFYLDNKSRAVNCILFEYSEDWFYDKDYHHFLFDAIYCKYSGGKYRELKRRAIDCNAYTN